MSDFLKRLPVIRHVRAILAAWRVERHYRQWESLGMLPVNRGKDEEVLQKIWKGEA